MRAAWPEIPLFAEIVASEIVRDWRISFAGALGSEVPFLAEVRRTLLPLLADRFVQTALTGFVDGSGIMHRPRRWRLTAVPPPIRAFWPDTALPREVTPVLRVQMGGRRWDHCAGEERRRLLSELAMRFGAAPDVALSVPLAPTYVRRLAWNSYLVMESPTLPTPSVSAR